MDLTAFHFLRPLWLLAILPAVFVWLGLRRAQRTSNQWSGQCDSHLLPHLLVGRATQTARWPLTAMLIAWVIASLAAAGPTWTQLPQPVFRAQDTRVIVLDLSRSMDATDVAPRRIARAKFKALDVLRASREGQTAMVVFAGEAYVLSPLTDDAATIAAQVPVLGTELMPSQGSRVDLALQETLRLLNQGGGPAADVILITDGADPSQAAIDAAQALRQAGHRLSVLSVGTADGAPIPLANGGFLKDANGAIVVAQVRQHELSQLASTGGGVFRALAPDNSDIDAIVNATQRANRTLQEAQQHLRVADSWRDEGPWLVLLLLPFAALAFRRGWVAAIAVVAILPLPRPAMALDWQSLWLRDDQRAAQALAQGDAKTASEYADDPAWQGTAYYQSGDYARATEAFTAVDSTDGRYNLGNALARQGRYQEALAAYQDALKRDPQHDDALFNKRIIEQLLKDQSTDSQQSSQGEANQSAGQNQGQGQNQSSASGDDAKGTQSDETSGGASDDPSADNESAGTRQRSDTPQTHSAQSKDQSGQSADQQTDQADSVNKDTEQAAVAQKQDNGQSTNRDEQRGAGRGQQTGNATDQPQVDAQATEQAEAQQAVEQWLRQIPDDPGGLLRRKFAREHQRINAPRGARDRDAKW